jgi:hypothetical protein
LPAEKALFKSPSVASIYHLLSVPQLVLFTLIAAAGRDIPQQGIEWSQQHFKLEYTCKLIIKRLALPAISPVNRITDPDPVGFMIFFWKDPNPHSIRNFTSLGSGSRSPGRGNKLSLPVINRRSL